MNPGTEIQGYNVKPQSPIKILCVWVYVLVGPDGAPYMVISHILVFINHLTLFWDDSSCINQDFGDEN